MKGRKRLFEKIFFSKFFLFFLHQKNFIQCIHLKFFQPLRKGWNNGRSSFFKNLKQAIFGMKNKKVQINMRTL